MSALGPRLGFGCLANFAALAEPDDSMPDDGVLFPFSPGYASLYPLRSMARENMRNEGTQV